ncbi:MAG: AAA family ATPase, partial [Chloroflexi bacterium]|nr:AAA family ATPase [Chloroflexota bacterium]
MMVFESSTTPVARQLKLLVYGGAGAGKTWFAIHAPSPLIIDTESSTDPYRGQPDLPPFTVAKNARPSEITATLEQFASLGYIPNGRERLQPETLVIDSFTLLWMVAQEAGQKLAEGRAVKYKRPPEEARLAFGDWSLIKRPIQRLYTQLLNLPVHVIVTARQKDIYDEATSEPRKVGEAPDIERNAVYNFDLVLKLEVDGNGKRTGLVEKSRFADFPPGTRIPDPAWATFAHLARTGEQPSQNIDLEAAAEQEARQMEPPAPPQNGRQKGPRAEWTRSPANRQRTLEWLAENGLSESDANAALGI